MNYQLKVKEQTIIMTYKSKQVTPDTFDPAIHNIYTLLSWHKTRSGKFVTVPVNDEEALTDIATFNKWAAQWGL